MRFALIAIIELYLSTQTVIHAILVYTDNNMPDVERDEDENDAHKSESGLREKKRSLYGETINATKRSASPAHAKSAEKKNCCPAVVAYQDYAHLGIGQVVPKSSTRKILVFPEKLHAILSNDTFQSIITWLPHGRAWKVLDRKRLEDEVFPLFFDQRCFSTFKRQICGWGFHRIRSGVDTGSYFHEFFLRGLPHLCWKMKRLTAKDMADRKERRTAKAEPEMPPDFHAIGKFSPLPVHPGEMRDFSGSAGPMQRTLLQSSYNPGLAVPKIDASTFHSPSLYLGTATGRDTASDNILLAEANVLGRILSTPSALTAALDLSLSTSLFPGSYSIRSALRHEMTQMQHHSQPPPPHHSMAYAGALTARQMAMQQQYREYQIYQQQLLLVEERRRLYNSHSVQQQTALDPGIHDPSRTSLYDSLFPRAAAAPNNLEEQLREQQQQVHGRRRAGVEEEHTTAPALQLLLHQSFLSSNAASNIQRDR